MKLSEEITVLGAKILTKSFMNKHYKGITNNEIVERTNIIMSAYQ